MDNSCGIKHRLACLEKPIHLVRDVSLSVSAESHGSTCGFGANYGAYGGPFDAEMASSRCAKLIISAPCKMCAEFAESWAAYRGISF